MPEWLGPRPPVLHSDHVHGEFPCPRPPLLPAFWPRQLDVCVRIDLVLTATFSPTQFTCQEAFSECIQANANDAQGQKNCTDNIQSKCGTLDPNKAVISSGSTTSAAPSGSTTPTGTGATGTNSAAATPTSSKNAGPTAAVLGNGAAVLAMGVLAAALL